MCVQASALLVCYIEIEALRVAFAPFFSSLFVEKGPEDIARWSINKPPRVDMGNRSFRVLGKQTKKSGKIAVSRLNDPKVGGDVAWCMFKRAQESKLYLAGLNSDRDLRRRDLIRSSGLAQGHFVERISIDLDSIQYHRFKAPFKSFVSMCIWCLFMSLKRTSFCPALSLEVQNLGQGCSLPCCTMPIALVRLSQTLRIFLAAH